MNPPIENSPADIAEEKPGVLPPWASHLMILLWLLLFGVRWLIITPLEWMGVLTPDTMYTLDDVILLRVYLILFVITCAVLGLRAARNAQSGEAGSSVARKGKRRD